MVEKMLGKIKKCRFGFNECFFGLILELGSDKNSWVTGTSIDYNPTFKDQEKADYTLKKSTLAIQELLRDAQVETIDQLKNKPIEATFIDNKLDSFRILEEVL